MDEALTAISRIGHSNLELVGVLPNPIKQARCDHPIHELVAARYSPYGFEPCPVEQQDLLSCLEAARWAASSFNEQPWSFLVATRQDPGEFDRMLRCLLEANQMWAQHAGVLMLTVVSKTFARNNKPNRVAEHDVGLAVANLSLQATALGLVVHQMAGLNLAKARQTYGIPESHDPLTGIALGHEAGPSRGMETVLGERDRSPRKRHPLASFVFADAWLQPAPQTLGKQL